MNLLWTGANQHSTSQSEVLCNMFCPSHETIVAIHSASTKRDIVTHVLPCNNYHSYFECDIVEIHWYNTMPDSY